MLLVTCFLRFLLTRSAEVGEPLYLTPYIDSGRIAEAQTLAMVTEPLEGLQPGEQLPSYAGFLTIDNATDSHMFFWFFPANTTDFLNKPVVVWLQGGPGSSSMFGLLEIHGPMSAIYDSPDENNTIVVPNYNTWINEANIIYIDNPVGTGFSHTWGDAFVTTQAEVGDNLYIMITQWLKLFPEYQPNPFYVFGESYGGKYVPTISKKIHDENQLNPEIPINFAGLGIGNGAVSPHDQHYYGQMLYKLSLIDEKTLANCERDEALMRAAIEAEDYVLADLFWSANIGEFLSNMGCGYYLDFTKCFAPKEEGNYADFMDKNSTRIAVHAGWIPFGNESTRVYNELRDDLMRSEITVLEFLLENYPVLIFNGNLDIVCHHTGHLAMFQAMENWSGRFEYYAQNATIWEVNNQTAGYFTRAQNLRLMAVRNAGHMVARSQPVVGLELFKQFLNGDL